MSDTSMGPPCVKTMTSGLVVRLAMRCGRTRARLHCGFAGVPQATPSGCRMLHSIAMLRTRTQANCFSHLPQPLLHVQQLQGDAVVALSLHQPVVLVALELRGRVGRGSRRVFGSR